MSVQMTAECRNVPVGPKTGSEPARAIPRHIQPITIRCARSTTASAKRSEPARPGEGAADGVQRVENDERAAPDDEARHEPPEVPGWDRTRAHGRAPSIVTSAGSASTRPSAMTPVTAV